MIYLDGPELHRELEVRLKGQGRNASIGLVSSQDTLTSLLQLLERTNFEVGGGRSRCPFSSGIFILFFLFE